MDQTVTLDLHQLVLGRRLPCPIRDRDGVLLVNSGTILTSEIKRHLLDRGTDRIRIDAAAAARATVDGVFADESELHDASHRLDEQLADLVRENLAQSGPPLKSGIVRHGKQGHDPATLAEVQDEQARNARQMEQVLGDAARTGHVDVAAVEGVSDACLRNLLRDVDVTIAACLSMVQADTIGRHSVRMATLAIAIGLELGYDADRLRTLGVGGLLADIGMAAVPEEILNATRRLSEAERTAIEKHPIHTANLLEKHSEVASQVVIVAYQVHECLDGSGYPRGKTREGIHPLARVLHLADAFAALTSVRPFRRPLTPYTAMTVLLESTRRGEIDADVARALLRAVSLFPIGSYVALDDGRVAEVLRANPDDFTRPIVKLMTDVEGAPLTGSDETRIVDLLESERTVVQALPTPGRDETFFDARCGDAVPGPPAERRTVGST